MTGCSRKVHMQVSAQRLIVRQAEAGDM